MTELQEYITGNKAVPVPTYFISSAESNDSAILKALSSPDCQADIHCLGRAGLEKVKDLSISFLGEGFSKVGA